MKEETTMFVRKNTWLSGTDNGWGNGYVVIPKDHKLYGIDYDDICVTVHGGLTFGEFATNLNNWEEVKDSNNGWVVGFDTSHCDDTILNWSKEAVIAETERLKIQIENYK